MAFVVQCCAWLREAVCIEDWHEQTCKLQLKKKVVVVRNVIILLYLEVIN